MPFARLERWLLPPRCVLCGGPARDRDLCGGCRADLPWIEHACRVCGLPVPARLGGGRCGGCLDRPPPFERTVIPFVYAFPVDRMLLDLKFAGGQATGRVLGELLADAVRARSGPRPDAIVPVPLHRSRRRERGYNQAEELAHPVARALGIPVRARACRRVRDTPPQSGLDRRRRRGNVTGAFTCPMPVDGLRLAVVDDVCTTGSTIAALARALLAGGATSVAAWCVARSVNRP